MFTLHFVEQNICFFPRATSSGVFLFFSNKLLVNTSLWDCPYVSFAYWLTFRGAFQKGTWVAVFLCTLSNSQDDNSRFILNRLLPSQQQVATGTVYHPLRRASTTCGVLCQHSVMTNEVAFSDSSQEESAYQALSLCSVRPLLPLRPELSILPCPAPALVAEISSCPNTRLQKLQKRNWGMVFVFLNFLNPLTATGH